jgi:hypothetical protein
MTDNIYYVYGYLNTVYAVDKKSIYCLEKNKWEPSEVRHAYALHVLMQNGDLLHTTNNLDTFFEDYPEHIL